MMPVDYQSQLDGWVTEYKVPGDVIWCGFKELGGSVSDGYTSGRCEYKATVSGNVREMRSDIYLDTGMRDAPAFFRTCVLWHEFCHANAYNEDGIDDSHNSRFLKYRKRKILYWLGDCIFKAINWIWVK